MQDSFAMFDIAGDLPTISGGATGTFYSTNSYDTGAQGTAPAVIVDGGTSFRIGGPRLHDLGRGRRLLFYAQIVTTYLAAAGASTLQVGFVADDDSAGTNRLTSLLSNAVAKANLTQGYRFSPGSTPGKIVNSAGSPARYVYAAYIIATNPSTAGKITSGLMLDVDDNADVLGGA